MSGLSERLKNEPDYRPYCLNCETMMRMTLEADGRTMWCEPVRDTTFDAAAGKLGIPLYNRYGCNLRFDIETGERLVSNAEGTVNG